jgi:hypothetical protein
VKRLFSARAIPAIVLSVAMCVRAQTQTNDAAAAAEPLWWSGIWAAGRVNANNDAPINVGQLKHVASRALAWLETQSITEAEEPAAYAALGVFRGMVAGWTPGPAADNAAPVPVGALKETAAKFHDVLAALGYPLVTGETVGDVMEAEEGLTNPPRYPWGAAGTLEELQAPANVGQLKTAFRAPHPGLVEGSVVLHGELTVADNGLPVAGEKTLAVQSLPVWGTPRMGAVTYAANGSSLVPNVPTLPSAVRLARPTLLRFSPWLSGVRFQGVVHFTAVEHRIGDVTTWIPVVSGGVLAADTPLPYAFERSAFFKVGTYVEFAHVAMRNDRPDSAGSKASSVQTMYPLVRRGTLAADTALVYSLQPELECTFDGGTEVEFAQFPRLIERAEWEGSKSLTRFEPAGMVARGTISDARPAQPVHISPEATVRLKPGTVAVFANFLTRQLTAAGAPPGSVPPTNYPTTTSGTGTQTSEFAMPAKGGRIPYFDAVANAGGRVFFWPLPEPRPGMLRPEDTVLSGRVTDGMFWYREREEAGGFLKRGIVAVDEEVPASVAGVGTVKCAAGHPIAIRHFLHEFTTPSPGSPAANQYVAPPLPESSELKVPGHQVKEEVIGYLAEAVTAGPGDVVMPGTNGMSITVPEDRAVAFEHDAAPLQTGGVPGARPVVRGRLIPESVSPVASNPQAADADGDGFTAGEEMRMGSSDGDAAVPGGVRPFLASALAGLGPHVIHDERDAPRPVGDELWGRQTGVSIPVTAEATKRYLSLVVTHRGFPRGTRSAVSDTLTWSLTGDGSALGGTVKASELHHVWLSSMAGGRTLGGARPFWVIPLGFVADGGAAAGVTVTTASERGEWVVAAVLTDDSQALAGVGGRFVEAGAGVPENHVRINDRPVAVPFARRPQNSGDSTPSGSAAGFDSDRDFSPDLEEQAAGTDPEDKYSAPVVLSSLVLNRETFRYVPNPHGWSGYTDLNVNDGWAVVDHSTPNSFGVSGLGRTYVTFPVPGTQYRTSDFHGTEYRGELDGHAKDFGSIWKELEPPAVSRGLPADNGGNDGVDAAWALYVPEPERRYSAPVPYRSEYLATTGKRYRLRGPLSDADQSRTFLRVCWEKTWPSYEAYMRDVRNFGYGWEEMTGPKTAALGDPVSVTMKTLTIPKGAQYSDEEVDLVPKLAMDPARDGMPRVVVERLLPVEFEIKHTEKERDADGNETQTVVNPGPDTMLRDEIVDIRIKVPRIGITDWTVDLTVEPEAMRNQDLTGRGSVKMYDFGQVETTGTVTPDKTQFVLQASAGGKRTIRAVFNKEGKLKIKMKSTDGKVDFTSPEYTIKERVRKYAVPYPGFPNHDPNKYDQQFVDGAKHWGDFYSHPIDTVDRLKAISVAESNVGALVQSKALRPHDILTIGHPDDNVLETLQGQPEKWDLDVAHPKKPAGDKRYRKLNYPAANIGSTREAIKWGVLWLYVKGFAQTPPNGSGIASTIKANPAHDWEHRNQAPYNVIDGIEEPEYQFVNWHTWENATGFYNGGGVGDYMTRVNSALQRGLHWNAGGNNKLWPIRSDKSGRP